jgi:hypothetical protein
LCWGWGSCKSKSSYISFRNFNKEFDVIEFFRQLNVSNQRKTKIKSLIIELLKILEEENKIELIGKDDSIKECNKLTPRLMLFQKIRITDVGYIV